MTTRLNPYVEFPELTRLLIDYAMKLKQTGYDMTIAHLVVIRASQLNRCAICLHMHTREALSAGETEERIAMLDAWWESPLYNDRERAALAWTEALTRLGDADVSDALYASVKDQFVPEDIVKLTLLIGAINAFNRLGVGFALGHPVATATRKAA